MTDYKTTKDALLNAVLPHVPFDGWSEVSFRAAAADAGIDMALARAVSPRGGLDLALAYHARGDAQMVERLRKDALPERFRDKIAAAVRFRIEAIDDREIVRRGTALFSLPMHVADGAKAIWGTADLIWTTLGDHSDDINWYTKRATLSGVYSATLLYWLGDESEDAQGTWAFLDRRIEDIMQIEIAKAKIRNNDTLSQIFAVPNWMMSQIKAPKPRDDMPGHASTS